jgi:serine/threonine protein kinase/tetratricopeptide (TPR) repeat protein
MESKPQDHSTAKELFLDALEVDESERATFVREACGNDDALRRRVQELLGAHRNAAGVFSQGGAGTEGDTLDLGPGDRVGPYRLQRLLGEGGFGNVFLASQDEPVRRQVALKIVKLGMDTKAVIARFEFERQALALMDHPGIARVYDAGATESGRPYFAMELVEGVPITDYCVREALDTDACLALFRLVCQAVQHAHQKGVLHRDLKPSNVLVATVDGRPEPKVIDFGIAKATGMRLTDESIMTREGFLLGTPAYMSPEQAEGALDIDTRTDVYSLGVLLYELLSGVPPFDIRALGFEAVRRAIREEDPPRPSTRRRTRIESGEHEQGGGTTTLQTVPRELDWIVMRCLEKEPGRRYATANDLADDVERFLADHPVEAVPHSTWYRMRKLARRHRAATFAAVGVVVAVLMGTVGTTLGLVKAERLNAELDDALKATAAQVRETERQAAVAQAVNSFLTDDLLAAVRPSAGVGRGRDVLMRDVLDRAAHQLNGDVDSGGRFEDEPLIEAALRYSIGQTYEMLGMYDPARHHMQRALDLRLEELGDRHPETLAAASYAGRVQERLGNYEEARSILREVLAAQREVRGDEDEQTLTTVIRLCTVLRLMGRSDESLGMLEEAAELSERVHGAEAYSTMDLLARLGIQYTELGRFEQAEEIFRSVIDVSVRRFGADNPYTLTARMNLGNLLRGSFRFDEARVVYEDVFERQRIVDGPEHPNFLLTALNLADCLRALDRYEEAHSLLQKYQSTVTITFAASHPTRLNWVQVDARVREGLGQFDAAERGYRAVWQASSAALGPNHPDTLNSQNDIASILFELGRYDEAEEMFLTILDGWFEAVGAEHPKTLRAQKNVASFYRQTDRVDEAVAHMEEVVRTARRVLGDDDLQTLEHASALAAALALSGDIRRALALVEEAASLQDLGQGNPYLSWLTAVSHLSHAYRAVGETEEADRWQAIVDEYGDDLSGTAMQND